jgi:hypothetical protein
VSFTWPDATVAVPSLNQWGMMILSGLMAAGTLVVMRRRG